MAKQAYVYSGTDWVPLASEVTNLSGYQTKALNQFAHRNLVINGDMQIAQRGTSTASITTSGYRTADRWNSDMSSLGTWTQSVENDAPTGSGFRKSLKMLCTTADASPAAGDYIYVNQVLEGQNLQQVKKGTSAAEQLTVSFWVKANVTGTYILEFYDVDNARQVSKSYTINASGVWEYKTITFAADTTGAFDNDNAASLGVNFYIGAGSNFTSGTLQTTWVSSTTANRAVGQTNVASATNNYWQVTGVQLEVGDVATPFEFKSVEDELLECQRYYFRISGGSNYNYMAYAMGAASVGGYGSISLPVSMRAAPSSVDFSTLGLFAVSLVAAITAVAVDSATSPQNPGLVYTVASGSSGGAFYRVLTNNSSSGYLGISAEL
jgi:hypothetical protein